MQIKAQSKKFIPIRQHSATGYCTFYIKNDGDRPKPLIVSPKSPEEQDTVYLLFKADNSVSRTPLSSFVPQSEEILEEVSQMKSQPNKDVDAEDIFYFERDSSELPSLPEEKSLAPDDLTPSRTTIERIEKANLGEDLFINHSVDGFRSKKLNIHDVARVIKQMAIRPELKFEKEEVVHKISVSSITKAFGLKKN